MTKNKLRVLLGSLAITAVLTGFMLPAAADVTVRTGTPVFSQEEKAVIARNAALQAIVATDPWTVRQFLDLLGEEDDEQDGGTSEEKGSSANPDLDRIERASPEGAHDLLQLIKQAGSGSGAK